MKTLKVGDTGCYIHDLFHQGWNIERAMRMDNEEDPEASIPFYMAADIIANTCPEVNMGTGTKGKDLQPERMTHNQWLNKLWVVVSVSERDGVVSMLYNHDGRIWHYYATNKVLNLGE